MENAKQTALHALTGVFIDRDPSVVERCFAPDYIQHNRAIPKWPDGHSRAHCRLEQRFFL
jgi:hypothetical protein